MLSKSKKRFKTARSHQLIFDLNPGPQKDLGAAAYLGAVVWLGITVNRITVVICCTFVICLASFPAAWGQFVEWHVNTIYFSKPN